jgi:nitrogen fixation/metabolism regulation signal transduction histidine kinase
MITEAVLPAGADAAVTRLAAGVAHELRNPLAGIPARAQLLSIGARSGRMPDAGKLERALETIEEQAVRASHVVEGLSAFARPRKPDLAPLDTAETRAVADARDADRLFEPFFSTKPGAASPSSRPWPRRTAGTRGSPPPTSSAPSSS